MKPRLLYLVLIVFGLSSMQLSDDRKMNFPKKVEFVEDMPHPDSLWIFVMAGQSNMAGRGFVEPKDTISNNRVLTIDKSGKWIYAKEPLNLNEPSYVGLDCGLSFANKLLEYVPEGISIGIIPCAIGGTAIEQWLDDEIYREVKLLSNFQDKVNLCQKNGEIKGILWHQGESNAYTELIPQYSDNLKSLTNIFRKIVKDDTLPIFMGQLGSYTNKDDQVLWDSINIIIDDFVEENENTYIIRTHDLKDKGDKLHFDSESQREMGRRFANEYQLNIINKN